jgi:putative tricarboxylic transport membrane protein
MGSRAAMTIRAPKDFWSGVMFLAFAAVALFTARGYSLGAVGHMGPGYFPMLLGGALALIGVILIARSLLIEGDGVGKLALLPLTIIIVGVCLFGLLIERLGLIVSLVIVTVVTALASRESKPIEIAVLALLLAAFSLGIFVFVLQLPLPIWPPFVE